MKKVLFCLSLIFGLLVLNQVPSFAMEFPVSPDMIGGLGDLGYGLLGGATFDFNDSIYAIDNWDNLTQELKDAELDAKAKLFLGDYCVRRGIPFEDINPDLPTDAKSFYKSQYFSSNVRTSWNSYKLATNILDQEAALRFPISPQAFSDWTGYSTFWYKKYADQLTREENPYIDYIPIEYDFINNLNTLYVRGYNGKPNINFFSLTTSDSYRRGFSPFASVTPRQNIKDCTFMYPDFDGHRINDPTLSNNALEVNCYYPVLTISLTTNQDQTVSANYSEVTGYDLFNLGDIRNNFNYGSIGSYPDSIAVGGGAWVIYPYTNNTAFNNLDNALDYIYQHFANVNLYVNGDPWILVNDGDAAPADIIDVGFPDIFGGNDEDPIPAYDIILPGTADNYGTFDITSLFDLIRQKIADASDSDPTTDGTLTGEDVKDTFKDRAGEAVDEEDVPIDTILDDSFPYEDTDNYPNLPPIPQIPLDDAFQGTTILSELIDSTQQILPEPLALAFWGMIFILFILGLIKILHK